MDNLLDKIKDLRTASEILNAYDMYLDDLGTELEATYNQLADQMMADVIGSPDIYYSDLDGKASNICIQNFYSRDQWLDAIGYDGDERLTQILANHPQMADLQEALDAYGYSDEMAD